LGEVGLRVLTLLERGALELAVEDVALLDEVREEAPRLGRLGRTLLRKKARVSSCSGKGNDDRERRRRTESLEEDPTLASPSADTRPNAKPSLRNSLRRRMTRS